MRIRVLLAALLCLGAFLAPAADQSVRALDCAQNARARIVSTLVGAKARTAQVVAAVNAQVTKWQLYHVDPLTFGFLDGAKGDNMVTTSAGSNTVTSTDNPWTAADVGKTIYLQGVGAQISVIPPFDYDPLITTISGYVSAGEITVTDAPARGVTANQTSRAGIAIWGELVPLTLSASPLTSPDGSTIYQRQALDLSALSSATVTATGGTVAATLANRFGDIATSKDYGTVGDGVADDTVKLQAYITGRAASGLVCNLLSGTYKITGDITLPRTVDLMGCGSTCVVKGTGVERIIVTGDSSPWSHRISGIVFDGVGITYGSAGTDYGRGAQIVECIIKNVTAQGVIYKHNSWATLIFGSQVHNCGTGIYFDFAGAVANSGASMKVAGSNIFNCTTGVYINGITTDGFNIHITDTDVEHCVTAIKTVAAGDGTVFMKNNHLELNSTNIIDMDGANIWLDGFWGVSYAAGAYSELFKITSGYLFIERGRFDWATSKLFAGIGGKMFVNLNAMLPSTKFFGIPECAAKATASSVAGVLRTTGGEHYVTQIADFNMAPAGAPTTFGKCFGCEDVIKRWTFDVEVQGGDLGVGLNQFNVYLDPGGATHCDLVLPLAAGVGTFEIIYKRGGTIVTRGTYNGTAVVSSVADPHGLTTDKFITIGSQGAPGVGSTIRVHNLHEWVSSVNPVD